MMRRTSRYAAALGLVLTVAAALAVVLSHQHWFWPRKTLQQAMKAARRPLPATAAECYAAAAQAFRAGDIEEIRRLLGGLADRSPHERERALLVLGLHEYASGHFEEAAASLQMLADRAGELEDWRLFALADSAARTGDGALADRALSDLLARDSRSPLRGRSLVLAAGRAWQQGNVSRALQYVELARAQRQPAAVVTEVDVIAWRLGIALGDRGIERTAAKRLLVSSPEVAKSLDVSAIFKDEHGRIDSWSGVLSRQEVEQRAENWLASENPLAAAGTLQTIPVADRDVRWYLLQAEALTQQEKGALAYSLLRSVFPDDREEEAKLEWERALAATDVATARPGRTNVASVDRQKMLDLAQRHLRRVVDMNVDSATSVSAVRKLYGMLAEADRFDESIEMLELLRKLDPSDRTGATHLWELGWSEFNKKNYSSAIGYWTQLEQIYPDDRETHRGRYWKARALEALGETGRAREMYREVLANADTADFYAREAAARLPGETPRDVRPGSLATTWPADGTLHRVLSLTSFGLDALAKIELDAFAQPEGSEEQRDATALEGILMVRAGDARKGVQLLRGAFPELGGPFQASIPRPVLEAYYPLQYAKSIESNAKKRGLPPALVAGIIRQESAFDSKAKSWAGARGLMQLMPATAREWAGRLGVDDHRPERLDDPEYSIELGTAYFKNVLDRMDGNVPLALAGYNGGPNRILRLWKQAGGKEDELDLFLERLDISESQAYVKRILVLSDSYRKLYPEYGT